MKLRQIPPREKRLHVRPRRKFLLDRFKLQPRRRRQRPFHHFVVGSRRQIRAAQRRMRANRVAGRRGLQPFVLGFQRRIKPLQPAVRDNNVRKCPATRRIFRNHRPSPRIRRDDRTQQCEEMQSSRPDRETESSNAAASIRESNARTRPYLRRCNSREAAPAQIPRSRK